MRRFFPVVLLAAVAVLAACGSDSARTGESQKTLRVAAAFYPVEEAARSIGGDRVRVRDLTPAGSEPHDLELTPPELADLERSDVVLYLGAGFQPQVQKAVASSPSDLLKVDLLQGLKLRRAEIGIPGVRGEVDGGRGPESLRGGRDPHVWVDPARFIAIARRIERSLIKVDPAGRDTYEANARTYLASLRKIDRDFRRGLRGCRSPVLVTSHAAFGYLADRYGLQQAAIAGISPEAEPDPASLAAIARYAKANDVRTVFFETLVPRKLSETVAREIGARTDALNPVEGLTRAELDAGTTYESIQRANLQAMKKGLECTGS